MTTQPVRRGPEFPLVPPDGCLAVMRTLDAARDRIGVRYPGESAARAQVAPA